MTSQHDVAARPEPPVEGALEEARAAAVAFGEANPDSDELDLASYAQGYRAALTVAARSGHDGLREALDDAARGYHAAMDHDWFGPTLPLVDCTDQRCISFRRVLSPDPAA